MLNYQRVNPQDGFQILRQPLYWFFKHRLVRTHFWSITASNTCKSRSGFSIGKAAGFSVFFSQWKTGNREMSWGVMAFQGKIMKIIYKWGFSSDLTKSFMEIWMGIIRHGDVNGDWPTDMFFFRGRCLDMGTLERTHVHIMGYFMGIHVIYEQKYDEHGCVWTWYFSGNMMINCGLEAPYWSLFSDKASWRISGGITAQRTKATREIQMISMAMITTKMEM